MGSPLALALRLYAEQRDEQLLQIVTKTLDAAAAIQAVQTSDAGPTAYVCVGTTCSLPTREPAAVATLVTTFQRRKPQGHGQDR